MSSKTLRLSCSSLAALIGRHYTDATIEHTKKLLTILRPQILPQKPNPIDTLDLHTEINEIIASPDETIHGKMKKLLKHPVVKAQDKETQREILSAVGKARGSESESEATDLLEKKLGKKIGKRNQLLYEQKIDPYTKLTGRVDGMGSDPPRVYEVKHRQTQLTRQIREYEYVQLQAYMFLTSTGTSVLAQHHAKESLEEVIEFNPAYWSCILEDAIFFSASFRELLSNESTQRQLIDHNIFEGWGWDETTHKSQTRRREHLPSNVRIVLPRP